MAVVTVKHYQTKIAFPVDKNDEDIRSKIVESFQKELDDYKDNFQQETTSLTQRLNRAILDDVDQETRTNLFVDIERHNKEMKRFLYLYPFIEKTRIIHTIDFKIDDLEFDLYQMF